MPHQLIRKLEHFVALSPSDKEALVTIVRRPLRNLCKGTDIISEGETAHFIRILLSGWAFRYKKLGDGRRQILSVVLPADICDTNLFADIEIDHSIIAATPLVMVEIPHEEINKMVAEFPALREALVWDLQVSMGLLHESIVNIGQRNALERMANLFCEIYVRQQMIGIVEGSTCHFPLTQADLAAVTGLSTVHVNRTLQEMRRRSLISLVGKSLRILNLPELKSVALFNPAFLHLSKPAKDRAAGIQPIINHAAADIVAA